MRTQTSSVNAEEESPTHRQWPSNCVTEVSNHIRVDMAALMPTYKHKYDCECASGDGSTGGIMSGWARGCSVSI